MCFLHSSDQKYVSFVNTNKDWSSNPSDWTSGGGGDGVFDISTYNAVGGTPATYSGLTQALGTNGANVPSDERSGGMSVKYIDSTSGKYEQWRYMGTDISTVSTFVNAANWQGVDETPTAGSQNLVTSGGVADAISGELGSDGNATNNTFINYSGAVVYYTGTIGSKRITNLTPGSSVIWKYGSTSESSAALKLSFNCYNSEGTRLSYTNYQSGSTERSVTIPANTAYVTASFISSFADAGIYDSTTGEVLYIPTLPSDGIKTEVDNLYRNFFEEEIPVTFNRNKALGMDGKSLTVATEHIVSDFIPVVEGDLYCLNIYSNFNATDSPYLAIAGYSAADEESFIYSAFPIIIGTGFPLITTIPKGVKYVKIQGMDRVSVNRNVSKGWGVWHYSANLSYEEKQNGVVQPMPTVSGYLKFKYDSVVTHNDKSYLKIASVSNSNTDRVRTLFSVDPGQRFLFNMSSSTDTDDVLLFFDSTMTMVARTGAAYGELTKTIEIPDGVKYLFVAYETGAIIEQEDNTELSIENDCVKDYLDNISYDDADYSYSKLSKYNFSYRYTAAFPLTPIPYTGFDKTLPKPIKVSWIVRSDASSQTISITFENGIKYTKTLDVSVSEYLLYNLIPNQRHLIEVVSTDSESVNTVLLSQQIVPTGRLRMIKAGNLANIRDIGGWNCLSGRTIDYGRVYICGSFSNLNADAKDILFNELGINCQIDINANDNPIDVSIDYTRQLLNHNTGSSSTLEVNLRYNVNFINTLKAKLREGKTVIVTGSSLTLAYEALFLIDCIMGLSESDISKDFEIGGFQTTLNSQTIYARTSSDFNAYLNYFKSHYSGVMLSERVINALQSSPLSDASRLTNNVIYAFRSELCKSFNEFTKYSLYGKTIAIIGDSIETHGNSGTDANAVEITIQPEDVGKTLSAYLTKQDVDAGLSLGGADPYTDADVGNEVTFIPTDGDIGKKIGLPHNYNDNSVYVWWTYLRDYYNCKIVPVCWSGSGYTRNRQTEALRYVGSYAWHDSQIRKCGVRIPGTMTRTAPDVIILSRGVNDMTHTPYATLTENYFAPYNWTYPENDSNGEDGYGLKEGISKTIQKLRIAYPKAVILIATMSPVKRVNVENFVVNNGLASESAYNDAIRECADFFGCEIINKDKCGITFENMYPDYINDNATQPTHPNPNGHRVIGEYVTRKVKDMFFDLK